MEQQIRRLQALKEMRDELTARLKKLQLHTHHRVEPLSADSKDQAVELQNQDTYNSLERTTRANLNEVLRALERVEKGVGDQCERCGSVISEDRFNAIIHATLCKSCAAKAYDN